MERGRITGFETRRYTKNGHIIDTRLGGGLLQDESGAPGGHRSKFIKYHGAKTEPVGTGKDKKACRAC